MFMKVTVISRFIIKLAETMTKAWSVYSATTEATKKIFLKLVYQTLKSDTAFLFFLVAMKAIYIIGGLNMITGKQMQALIELTQQNAIEIYG